MDSHIDQMDYQAYLVRVWPVQRGGEINCRVSLEHVNTGDRLTFPNLERLHNFLRTQAETSISSIDKDPKKLHGETWRFAEKKIKNSEFLRALWVNSV